MSGARILPQHWHGVHASPHNVAPCVAPWWGGGQRTTRKTCKPIRMQLTCSFLFVNASCVIPLQEVCLCLSHERADPNMGIAPTYHSSHPTWNREEGWWHLWWFFAATGAGAKMDDVGFEPTTSRMQSGRSITELNARMFAGGNGFYLNNQILHLLIPCMVAIMRREANDLKLLF